MKHIIIGTAGHIDHGKTTLIKALTGRDTDTLKEEKERGISINLGFTYFDLPSGKRAGIVDVPGHEKFIKNMLAGASGIDMVLLVIAGDEGIMPQTREHLNILSLLDIKKGIVVVTKKDMVDAEWLDAVIEDIEEYLKGTFLESSRIIPVSSITGDGVDELIKAVDLLAEEIDEKNIDNPFRLPVDRVFTVSGFGTVVTGTLISGEVSEGEKVKIYPSNIEVKVRNIQVHEQPVKSASAGQRVAVNLSNVKVQEIERGNVVAKQGCMEPSMMIDCRLNYLKDADKPLENRDRVRVYHGTSELFGRVVIIDKGNVKPGETCFVQIRLESPISAMSGDKYVIRLYSPMVTIGGGTIIDSNPTKRKRFDKKAIDELLTREQGNPEEIIEHILLKNSKLFPGASQIEKLSGRNNSDVKNLLSTLELKKKLVEFITTEGTYYAHIAFIDELSLKIRQHLEQFHSKNPLKYGVPKEEIKSRLFEGNVKQKLYDDILSILEDRKVIKSNNKYVALFEFSITLTKAQEKIKECIISIYNSAGINVSKTEEVISSVSGEAAGVKSVLELLIDTGELVKINDDMIISDNAFNYSVKVLKDFFDSNKDITLAQYRDILDTSRKYAVSLLEYLDQAKITRRVGDKRTLF